MIEFGQKIIASLEKIGWVRENGYSREKISLVSTRESRQRFSEGDRFDNTSLTARAVVFPMGDEYIFAWSIHGPDGESVGPVGHFSGQNDFKFMRGVREKIFGVIFPRLFYDPSCNVRGPKEIARKYRIKS